MQGSIGGFTRTELPLDASACAALKSACKQHKRSKTLQLLTLQISDDGSTIVKRADQSCGDVTARAVAALLDPNRPGYAFLVGGKLRKSVFIYCCPTRSRPQDRMLYVPHPDLPHTTFVVHQHLQQKSSVVARSCSTSVELLPCCCRPAGQQLSTCGPTAVNLQATAVNLQATAVNLQATAVNLRANSCQLAGNSCQLAGQQLSTCGPTAVNLQATAVNHPPNCMLNSRRWLPILGWVLAH
jgi:hypothetical protein